MGYIEKHKDEKMYIEIKDYNINSNIKHLFTSRLGWNQKDIFGDLSKVWDIPEEKIYRVKQVHGKEVVIIKNQAYKKITLDEKDGLITNVKGIALATYHADCVPIYFHDPIEEVVGLAHAGWKGSLSNIVNSMLEKMIEGFDSKVENIRVAIGPCICLACYEIGEDLVEKFSKKYPDNRDIFIKENGKTYLNLLKVNKINLLESGIKEKNIYYSDLCTSCNIDKLYSYRKERKTKNRMLGAIMLEKNKTGI